jgi:anaerobic ribonucleoside-triphosphate reductase activating protein
VAEHGADGITISGGEPLDQASALAAFLCRARECRVVPGSLKTDILLYTGYELAEARQRSPSSLALADAVITGRYRISEPTRLIWRGSARQRLIPLTELGWERYRRYINAEAARPTLQVGSDAAGFWIIGVPRNGDLARLEREFRNRGISLSGVSWRSDRTTETDAQR